MTMAPGCPRCAASVTERDAAWFCGNHGRITPLWVSGEATYDAFAEHLASSADLPTYLPWPMGPGWSITRFGCVARAEGPTRATAISCAGTTVLDGPVEVTVVTEEAGVGLGARITGTAHDDPGEEVGRGSPQVRVRLEHHEVPLWAVSTSQSDSEFDRSVFAGEARGRWLWLMLRPASAALLLGDDWILADVAEAGPGLVEMSFGGPPPQW